MPSDVRLAVEAIWQAMGLAAPPEEIGERFDFSMDDTEVELRLTRDGRSILVEAVLGDLSANPQTAGDQLRRLLRVGLALSAVNRSALSLLGARDTAQLAQRAARQTEGLAPLQVRAVARIDGNPAREAIPALQDVLGWRQFSDPILERVAVPSGRDTPIRRSASDPTADMVIFQP